MVKFFIVVIVGTFVAPHVCIPIESISEYTNILEETSYHFSYKTKNSERSETGLIEESNGNNQLIRVDGAYSFIATDGNRYQVEYQADENGYRSRIKSGISSNFLQKSAPVSQNLIKINDSPFVPYIGSAVLGSLVGGGLG